MSPCLIGYEIEPVEWLEAGWFVTPSGMLLFPARKLHSYNIRYYKGFTEDFVFQVGFNLFLFLFTFLFLLPQPAECGAEETFSKRCPDAGVGRDCLDRI